MIKLQATDFRQFFYELHGKNPFPWQEALAEKVCSSNWPEVIDLPTASGKTACIDIALFAMAVRGTEVPRRIFFVVDRRVVVNEAYLRMQEIQGKLRDPKMEVVANVSDRLKALGRSDEPLSVYEMRGGAFRDETWVKNPLQPAVIASTVDQVGSRLLFRGYGVSENSWPLHAGLIGNDSLIILDEAHCSLAFAQTLSRIEQYRDSSWAQEPVATPFRFVEMTATPSRDRGERFHITESDRADTVFGQRLRASKPVRLVDVPGKKDDFGKLADALIAEATELAAATSARRVAVLVNRVPTAKLVRERLIEKAKGAAVELVIGRMRPVDRDDLYQRNLKNLKSGAPREPEGPPVFVVSTQCLEVGADLDFDVLVSECASIDALQQRFGRLDRLGNFQHARGAIVIGSWQINPKQPDPVYGEALSKTWEWLKSIAGENNEVNMGLEPAEGQPPTVAELLKSAEATGLRLTGEAAPVLLPTHVDALVQTSPVPEPDPLIELFLHGPKRGAPDVQVLWRADLPEQAPKRWRDIVALCPPSSRECMPVQIGVFKKWFAGQKNADEIESDLGLGVEEDEPAQMDTLRALVWPGDGDPIRYSSQVRPGQTLILPESAGGWNELGYIPHGAAIDVGDRAAFEVRRSVSLRLHPKLTETWPKTVVCERVREYVSSPDAALKELEGLLGLYYDELLISQTEQAWPFPFLDALRDDKLHRRELELYPFEETAYVLQARKSKHRAQTDQPIPLGLHLREVEQAAGEFGAGKFDMNVGSALKIAARFHDYGKADVRYQAWLRGGDLLAAKFAPTPVAKSGNVRIGRQETVGLPPGFRHELLSLLFAERSDEVHGESRDLILHLIASHHGRCRPFPPVVLDDGAECVTYEEVSVCARDRVENAPHRLSSGVPERFWRLTRRYGWWGLAYLEALLRLADWKVSEKENAEVSSD